MKIRNSAKGSTLSELLIATVIFMLLALSLVSAVTLGLRYWLNIIDRTTVQQNSIIASECIACELRQAVVNPNPNTGYLKVYPAIFPSGVLYPNKNTEKLDYIEFTEPNPSNYIPSQVDWDPTNPANYRLVKYYTENNTLYRKEITYSQNGTILTTSVDPVVQSINGTLTFEAKYNSPNIFSISVKSVEGENTCDIDTEIYIPTQ